MSTGTSGGLLDELDDNAQSLFKHEVLSHYLRPFISMTGRPLAVGAVLIRWWLPADPFRYADRARGVGLAGMEHPLGVRVLENAVAVADLRLGR